MEQMRRLYHKVLETNQETFAHCLFVEACQSLSTALHCAFDLQDEEKLAEVEGRVQQQLHELEGQFAMQLSPLESPELRDYRTLAELATTYRALVQNGRFAQNRVVDGHKFEEVVTIDAHSGTARPIYTIDDIAIEPGTWEARQKAAQGHEKAATYAHEESPTRHP